MKNKPILKKIIIYLFIGIVSLTMSYFIFNKEDFIKSFIIISSSVYFGIIVFNFFFKKKTSN